MCWLGFHQQPREDMRGSSRHEHGIQNQTVRKSKMANRGEKKEKGRKKAQMLVSVWAGHTNMWLSESLLTSLWFCGTLSVLKRSITSALAKSQTMTTLYSNSTPELQKTSERLKNNCHFLLHKNIYTQVFLQLLAVLDCLFHAPTN